MDPSAVEFYAQIIRFLQCVNLTSKFAGQAPNGYEIITHGSNRFGKFVRYNYNTLTEKIGEEKLDLFDYKTGLKNYRVHMGQVGEEILTALSGDLDDQEHCFVFDKKYIKDDCGQPSQYVIELLNASIAKIGCKPGITRSQNILYPLNRKEPVVYSTEVKTQFNCESKFGVFGNKIVFKNKGEDVCKEVDWAADHVWKATQCSNHEQYTLNSKKFQFFSMRYLTIKFESGTCKRPTEPSAQFLDSTYIKYFYLTDGEQEALGITTATEKESKDERNWMLIGGISFGCVLTVAALATAAAAAIFRKCKKWKQPLKPAFYVRYDFGVASGMQEPKQCPNGFKKTKLKSGTKLVVPNVIDGAKVKKMVGQGQFGAFYLYQYEKELFWYKLEAKLSPPFKNPMVCESGLCEMTLKKGDSLKLLIGLMINCGYYSEGVYYMRVENLGPNFRDLRRGVVLNETEVAKILCQIIPCVRAMAILGICHRNFKESAFYFKKKVLGKETKIVITDLGYAVRIGSVRPPVYATPELATTFIYETKAYAIQDLESLIFMLFSMMMERLPWAGIKKFKDMTAAKLKYLNSNMQGTSLDGNKTAGFLIKMREMLVSDQTKKDPAGEIYCEISALMEPSKLFEPINWPKPDVNNSVDQSVMDSAQNNENNG